MSKFDVTRPSNFHKVLKTSVSSPSFKISTNLKINLDGEKDRPDVKSNRKQKQYIEPNTGSNAEHKQDTKPHVKSNKEHKQDVKPNIELKHDVMMIRTKPDTNKITYEE